MTGADAHDLGVVDRTVLGGVGAPLVDHPLEGGLIQAVAEAALAGETGCRLVLPEGADPFVTLFSESTGRVLVAVPRTEESRLCSILDAREMPWVRIGVVDQGSDSLEVQGQFSVTLDELREVHEGTLPKLFG